MEDIPPLDLEAGALDIGGHPIRQVPHAASLGKALDTWRKTESASLPGKGRCFIKGPEYTLLSCLENF